MYGCATHNSLTINNSLCTSKQVTVSGLMIVVLSFICSVPLLIKLSSSTIYNINDIQIQYNDHVIIKNIHNIALDDSNLNTTRSTYNSDNNMNCSHDQFTGSSSSRVHNKSLYGYGNTTSGSHNNMVA